MYVWAQFLYRDLNGFFTRFVMTSSLIGVYMVKFNMNSVCIIATLCEFFVTIEKALQKTLIPKFTVRGISSQTSGNVIVQQMTLPYI